MNYNMLTNKEILRIAEPETELEKRLLTLVDDMDRADSDEVEQLTSEIGSLENEVAELESDKLNQDDDIASLESDIEDLKTLLDDNKIEYEI